MTDYSPVLPFLPYQEEDFLRFRDQEVLPNLYEQGLGKTKVSLDIAAWQFATGRIEAVLVIAQNGIHRNWVERELPKHLPEWCNARSAVWNSTMRADQRKRFEHIFDDPRDRSFLRVLAMNVEAFGVPRPHYNKKAGKVAQLYLDAFRTLVVVDEFSFCIKGGKRASRITSLCRDAVTRHGLDGTPITKAPLDLWQPFEYMRGTGEPLLGPHSVNKQSFDSRYADWVTREQEQLLPNGATKRWQYRVVLRYKNLEELEQYVDDVSVRRLKSVELPHLPPKLPVQIIPVELCDEQRRLYRQAKQEGVLVNSRGGIIDTDVAAQCRLRQRQIVGGFLPVLDGTGAAELVVDKPEKLPKVSALLDVLDRIQTGDVIVFCAFVAEAKMLQKVIGERVCAIFVGEAHYETPADREQELSRFLEDPACRVIVATNAMARGYTLVNANTVVYYSNFDKYDDRAQSEDRPHRPGQKNPVTYIDLVATNTVDETIKEAHAMRKDLSDYVLGDHRRMP